MSLTLHCLLQRLPHDRHIILVDLLGHGDSSIPTKEEDANLVKIVDSLHELIHLIPNLTDRPFHMIGTSMGGLITATYSSLYPQEVCRATLICPASRSSPCDLQRCLGLGMNDGCVAITKIFVLNIIWP